MNYSQIHKILRDQLPNLKSEYKVKSMGIFGSYVHGQQNEKSDLDILVSYIEKPGFFQFIALENYLSDLLGIKVDLVMESALKPGIRDKILSEVIFL